jgi:haloalkane dehalogenase
VSWTDKKTVEIDGIAMAYVDRGEGAPVLFLHGNPTSSYLWRNVMPHVAAPGRRLIAPDLVGMGDSAKLPGSGPESYSFVEHRHYLDRLIEQAIGPEERVTLIVHDWGSALGFHWARRNPDRVRGVAFMEAIVAPFPDWEHFPESAREIFQGFRSPAGEDMILEKNLFVEAVLPGSILRKLAADEKAENRRPFAEPGENRRPTLSWPRQIPIAGEPRETVAIVADYAAWLPHAAFPKLFVDAEPGALVWPALRHAIAGWDNLDQVTVPGIHFIQEDSPDEIGRAIAEWMGRDGI